jgi:hypothetical protein
VHRPFVEQGEDRGANVAAPGARPATTAAAVQMVSVAFIAGVGEMAEVS